MDIEVAKKMMQLHETKPRGNASLPPSNNYVPQNNDQVKPKIKEEYIPKNVKNDGDVFTEEEVEKSNLPDSIKNIMKGKVKPKQTSDRSAVKQLVGGSKRLMKEYDNKEHTPQQTYYEPPKQTMEGFDMTKFRDMVRDVVRDTLKEELNKTNLNEGFEKADDNLVFKINDSIFKAKIVGVKKSKK